MVLLGDAHFDPPILGQATLADVKFGHDFDAGDQGIPKPQRRIHDLGEGAVNSIADTEILFVGLDVDVAGPAVYSLGQNNVDEFDNRRLGAALL